MSANSSASSPLVVALAEILARAYWRLVSESTPNELAERAKAEAPCGSVDTREESTA